jgi:hypothetical protein
VRLKEKAISTGEKKMCSKTCFHGARSHIFAAARKNCSMNQTIYLFGLLPFQLSCIIPSLFLVAGNFMLKTTL